MKLSLSKFDRLLLEVSVRPGAASNEDPMLVLAGTLGVKRDTVVYHKVSASKGREVTVNTAKGLLCGFGKILGRDVAIDELVEPPAATRAPSRRAMAAKAKGAGVKTAAKSGAKARA
jgi:hypothetical protein